MWEYIKKHDLQNPSDKREILLDETLQKVCCTSFTYEALS